jgi:hypothetical protein
VRWYEASKRRRRTIFLNIQSTLFMFLPNTPL